MYSQSRLRTVRVEHTLWRTLLGFSLIFAFGLQLGSAVPRANASGGDGAFPVSGSWPAAVQNFITAEESEPMLSVLYKYGEVTPGADGCYDVNCGSSASSWAVEWQRMGFRDVMWGVFQDSPSEIKTGLKMFDFAFKRQSSNGSFSGSTGPFHGVAMFLAEAAPALIVLKYSPYGKQFSKQVATQAHDVNIAARYVYYHGRHIEKLDGGATDRFFEAGLAFQSAGVLTNDTKLETWATPYIQGGIKKQLFNGIFPEWGGHDVYYQALGMEDACRYLTMIGAGTLFTSLHTSLQRGEKWVAGRVAADGTIDSSGDTRSKSPFPYSVVSAFARWATLGKAPHYEVLAKLVWKRYY